MNLTIRHEKMSDLFDKYHIEGLPFPAVIHHFKGPEPEDSQPHDHPGDMDVKVLHGWYAEKRIFPVDGCYTKIARRKGDNFKGYRYPLDNRNVRGRVLYIYAPR